MKLFVTGGTGFVGSNIIRVATEKHNAKVFTTTNSWQPEGEVGFQHAKVDMGDRDALMRAVRDFQPDAIIHNAILNDFPRLYKERKLAWQLYVDATRTLVDVANELGCKIVLVSTDWVFDGTQADADESTPPNPVNYYGVLKVVCEQVISDLAHNGAVARIAGVSGWHWLRPDLPLAQGPGYGLLAQTILSGLQESGQFEIWSGDNINMRATPSLASESAEMMMQLIEKDLQGIFHCTGSEAIGRVELARLVAEVFGYDPSNIAIVPPPPIPGFENVSVPKNTSLVANKTGTAISYTLPTVREQIEKLKRQVETGQLAL